MRIAFGLGRNWRERRFRSAYRQIKGKALGRYLGLKEKEISA
jgi:hypothetical protein